MPTLTTRSPSLCLSCTLSFTSSRARRLLRLFPYVQTARRSSQTRPRILKIISTPGGRQWEGRDDGLQKALTKLRFEIEQPDFLETLQLTPESFEKEWSTFTQYVQVLLKRGSPELVKLPQKGAYGRASLETKLRYLFYAQACGGRFTEAELDNQKALANLRYPAEWFPATRELQRNVHLHVGPTNSGKTYHALKRLEDAECGIYLGPLRLLAHEVYTRLNAKGKSCALVTGEEQRLPEGEFQMWSCTVEMAPLNRPLDVAVIDEIQMINHKERGWAWTQAFLGIQAKEIHLCGETRTVPLIREICALLGDKIEVHEYERLTPLKVAGRSLGGNINALQKGDCVVAFSVLGIHSLRRIIETKTGRKCAMVYGSLPPETRAQQARLFNDPDNDYDFLVASDAIGMGLNLSIKRVIFESTMKSNGEQYVPLATSEIKQIAGRAGRFRTAHQDVNQAIAGNEVSKGVAEAAVGLDTGSDVAASRPQPKNTTVGYVTTLEDFDFDILKQSMRSDPGPIRTAGLFPPSLIVERFASYFPSSTPFSYIMLRLHEIADIHPRFHLCVLRDQLNIADAIHTIKNLSVQERIMICAAPAQLRTRDEFEFLRALARCIADGESGELLDLPIVLEILDKPPSAERAYLRDLEQLHKSLVLYLWLSYRFPQVFTTRALASYAKKLVEDAIETTLSQFSFTEVTRKAILRKRRKSLQDFEDHEMQTSTAAEEEEDDDGDFQELGTTADHESGLADVRADVLKDDRSFDEGEPARDDENEYPSPELESEDTRLSTDSSQPVQHSESSSGESKAAQHIPQAMELNSERPNTQIRVH